MTDKPVVLFLCVCGDTGPVLAGKRYEDWELTDPIGLRVEQVRPIRDEIERRVRALADSG
jgi:arsenate reductase (thioredoxin)